MLKAEILQTESSIFHRTVLEGYWEFGARIGTKMKLTVSAFSSFRLFLFSKTTKLLNFWKCVKISFQNTTLTSRVWANTLDKYRDIAFWRYVYSRISKKVSTLNACAIWWASGEKIVPLEHKNNYARNETAYECTVSASGKFSAFNVHLILTYIIAESCKLKKTSHTLSSQFFCTD